MVTTEDAENVQTQETENTEIVIVNVTGTIKKVRKETGIVLDLERRSTRREDKVTQTRPESDSLVVLA